MLTLVLFSLTACSDPGIIYQLPSEIEPQLEKGEGGMYPNTIECSQCRMARPRTASHCYECGVCVDCLDHHCPVRCNHCLLHIILYIVYFIFYILCTDTLAYTLYL